MVNKLSNDEKKHLRSIGHGLKPVLIISENSLNEDGLNEGLLKELERALNDHELIKVKLAIPERDDRKVVADEVLRVTGATLVQTIGKMLLILRHAPKPNAKLSNLLH